MRIVIEANKEVALERVLIAAREISDKADVPFVHAMIVFDDGVD